MMDKAAGNDGLGADRVQVWAVVLDVRAEVRPGLHHRRESVPKAPQVRHDVRAVAEQSCQELEVAQARNRPVHRVMESVQGVDLSRPDSEAEHARHGERDDEAGEDGAERGRKQRQQPRGRVCCCCSEGGRTQEHVQLWHLLRQGEQQREAADADRKVEPQHGEQLSRRVDATSPGAGRTRPPPSGS